MNHETWNTVNQQFLRYRDSWAEPVPAAEFDEAFRGLPTVQDYRDFVMRYGGAIVGGYPIYGLRLSKAMGTFAGKGSAPEITRTLRDRRWPGVEDWLVFSTDGFGNPVGLAADGSVWISDAPRVQVQKLAGNFEDFLLKWALRTE